MNKLITANAKRFIICIALQLVCASPGEAQSNNALNLGSKDHVVYIDITKLPTKIKFENEDILMLYDAKRSAESFYHKWAWGFDNCPAGSLREGVIAYCLPCVGLGRHISDRHHQQPDRFDGIGPVGIIVWYEPDTDRFYLWNNHWNFSNVLGPFVGNPKLALNQAEQKSCPNLPIQSLHEFILITESKASLRGIHFALYTFLKRTRISQKIIKINGRTARSSIFGPPRKAITRRCARKDPVAMNTLWR